jgi:hypothetical protein
MNEETDPRSEYVLHAFAAMFFGGFLRPGLVRSVPGGPFVSISHDVLPILFFGLSIGFCIRLLKHQSGYIRLFAFLLACVNASLVCSVMSDMISFWLSPRSRGQLIAF